jgi:hypothetical protein
LALRVRPENLSRFGCNESLGLRGKDHRIPYTDFVGSGRLFFALFSRDSACFILLLAYGWETFRR